MVTILAGQSRRKQQLQLTSPRDNYWTGVCSKPSGPIVSSLLPWGSGSRSAEECGMWGAERGCASDRGSREPLHQPRLQGTSQHGLQLCLLPQIYSVSPRFSEHQDQAVGTREGTSPSLPLHSPSPPGIPSSALEIPMPLSLNLAASHPVQWPDQ